MKDYDILYIYSGGLELTTHNHTFRDMVLYSGVGVGEDIRYSNSFLLESYGSDLRQYDRLVGIDPNI